MFDYYLTCLKKYADFSGCAKRPEFWFFCLVNFLIMGGLSLIGLNLISVLVFLFTFIPSLSVAVRRMHDIKKSGLNLLWIFLPVIGWIIVIVYLARPSK